MKPTSLDYAPLLTAEQNQMLYKNGAIVDQDIRTCIGWFEVRDVRANRKQAMRFCLTNNNFAARGQGTRRASYDACMNQNDIVTALCTQELNVRAAFDRNYRGQVYSCPAAAPASYGESAGDRRAGIASSAAGAAAQRSPSGRHSPAEALSFLHEGMDWRMMIRSHDPPGWTSDHARSGER